MRWLVLLALALLAIAGPWWSPIQAASPSQRPVVSSPGQSPTPAAQDAKVGMLVTQLYNFQPAASSFDAELWLWSLAPADGVDIIKTSSFVNAYSTESLPEAVRRGQKDGVEKVLYGQKVRGTFHHDWNLVRFPFDRQNFQIILEQDERESSELRLVPDTINSIVDAEITEGWRLIRYSLKSEERSYRSDFGDQLIGGDSSSQYSRLVMSMELVRTSAGSLWRLCAAPLAAVLIVLVSYRIDLAVAGALPARGGLIGASLFAEIVSLRSVGGSIDNGSPLTLIEALHVLAVVYTLVAAVMTSILTVSHARSVSPEVLHRLEARVALISSLVLIALVLVLFLQAAYGH